MSAIDQIQVYNTGLTKEQISEAFTKALADYTKTEIDGLLGAKVDKITGKELSSNDYTDGDKEIVEGLYGHGIDLEDGEDLDDITDAGTYYASLSVAAQLDNTPVTSSDFRLEVSAVTRLKVLQRILPLPVTGNIYYRSYDGSVWSSWYVFTGTAVV